MISLSQTSAHAVHALSCLCDQGHPMRFVRDVAETTGVPRPYLAKIINLLNHHGLVRAKRGYRGGVTLARPPKEITLLQVVQAVEGNNWIGKCLMGSDECAVRTLCPTHKAWRKVRLQIETMLRTTTLADTIPFSRLKGHRLGAPRREEASKSCCRPDRKCGRERCLC